MADKSRNQARLHRHQRVRKKVFGTPDKPRLCVFRSLTGIYAQLIDDEKGFTLVSSSNLDPEIKDKAGKMKKIEQATEVGKLLGERAVTRKITTVVFDRGGFQYMGRIKALAEAAREAGLQF
ncbi:MAG: 50S ribosomal protein L18 [Pelolinea sp.]|nr:50S ribosomal protein L18 [Pelolinea sp.]